MSALDALIQVKKQADTEDLILLLDEIAAYEKLSKAAAFRDLKTSEVARKKLPLLTKAYAGDLYCLCMMEMARNILTHLNQNEVPKVVTEPFENLTERTQKRIEMMESSIITVHYRSLYEYRDKEEKDRVVAVFTENVPETDQIAALIIVRSGREYTIYQGYYQKKKKEEKITRLEPTPFIKKEDDLSLSILTYSVQGNNAYPFATLKTPSETYSVMFASYDNMWLTPESGRNRLETFLTREERNYMGMAKTDITLFSDFVMKIARQMIEKSEEGKEHEKTESST